MKYTYTFDQLKDCPGENTSRLFLDYKSTVRCFGGVDLTRYITADHGTIEAHTPQMACEKLYLIYNAEKPEGYRGRSMSVSDIVTLWDNSVEPPQKSTWFCDSFGFKLLKDSSCESVAKE